MYNAHTWFPLQIKDNLSLHPNQVPYRILIKVGL